MREIPLANGRGVALVDDGDYGTLSQMKWYLSRGYAATSMRRRWVSMHRMLCEPPAGWIVDHINGDRLDNRRGNMRICTSSENSQNRMKRSTQHGRAPQSRYKGVIRWGNAWRVTVNAGGSDQYIRPMPTEEEAARAYDAEARRRFGAFACTNFPRPGERSALTGEIEPPCNEAAA